MARRGAAWSLLLGLVACGPDGGGAATSTGAPGADAATSATTPTSTESPAKPTTSPTGPVGIQMDPSGRPVVREVGPPIPIPLRADDPLSYESPLREEQGGVSLEARFVARGAVAPHKAPEVVIDAITAAKKLTEATLAIDLTTFGRMRLASTSRALPIPFGSEVRARHDRWGHIVMWPNGSKFRIIAPGALRATLGERRVDVTPLVTGERKATGTGKVIGFDVKRFEVKAPLAKIRLDLAASPEAGLGGPLLCRFLVELAGVDPATEVCKADEVPLGASIDWADGGGIDFEVTSLKARTDIGGGEALVPPPGAQQAETGLPEASGGIYLTAPELAAFRSRSVMPKERAQDAPGEGFMAENGHDVPMVFLIDGVPTVGVPASGSRYVIGTAPGTYSVACRSFLGDRSEPPVAVELPAIVRCGAPKPLVDAGP